MSMVSGPEEHRRLLPAFAAEPRIVRVVAVAALRLTFPGVIGVLEPSHASSAVHVEVGLGVRPNIVMVPRRKVADVVFAIPLVPEVELVAAGISADVYHRLGETVFGDVFPQTTAPPVRHESCRVGVHTR